MQLIGYHHSISHLEKVLPKLLEKVLASNQRAVVMAETDKQLKTIDAFLWTYSKTQLLPHGMYEDGNPTYQPIWLTCTEENPNKSQILVLIGNMQPTNITSFERILILNPEWSPMLIQWAKNQGKFTLWAEQTQGGWTQNSN